jgi:hypothetical protein
VLVMRLASSRACDSQGVLDKRSRWLVLPHRGQDGGEAVGGGESRGVIVP